jgi:energy-converting hydrogenase Eha subunit E
MIIWLMKRLFYLAQQPATSIMTIIGIAIILTPVLIRTWREFRTNR